MRGVEKDNVIKPGGRRELEGRKADRISGVRVANYQAAAACCWVSQMDAWANPTTKLELVCTLCLWHSFLHCTLNYSGISKPFFHHIFSDIESVHRNLNAVPQVWICLIMSQHKNQNTLSHDLYYDSKAILSSYNQFMPADPPNFSFFLGLSFSFNFLRCNRVCGQGEFVKLTWNGD